MTELCFFVCLFFEVSRKYFPSNMLTILKIFNSRMLLAESLGAICQESIYHVVVVVVVKSP